MIFTSIGIEFFLKAPIKGIVHILTVQFELPFVDFPPSQRLLWNYN